MQIIVFLLTYPVLIGFSILPHFVLYGLSDLLYVILYRVFGYRTKVVRKNLNLCFPDKSEKELQDIERSFYKHLCDLFVEMIKALTVSKKQVMKRFKFKNTELVNQYLRNNRGVVLVCGHYSSWEGMLSIGYHIEGKGYAVYTPFQQILRTIDCKV